MSDKKGEICHIETIKRSFASEMDVNVKIPNTLRRFFSEPDIYYSADYDDLCGPGNFEDNPIKWQEDASLTPKLCCQFLSVRETSYIKNHWHDENAVKHFIEKKISKKHNKLEVFLELAWVTLKFSRDIGMSDEGLSSFLGIFFITHFFFIANPCRTAVETFNFFEESLLLHTYNDSPKSAKIFEISELKILTDFFVKTYLRQLPLIRFVCLPHYYVSYKIPKSFHIDEQSLDRSLVPLINTKAYNQQ